MLALEQVASPAHQSQAKERIEMTKFYIHYVRYVLAALATVAFGTTLN